MIHMHYDVSVDGQTYRIELEKQDPSANAGERVVARWSCSLNGRVMAVDAALLAPGVLSLLIGTHSFSVRIWLAGDALELLVGGKQYSVTVLDPRSLRQQRAAARQDSGPLSLKASMPGKVVRLLKQEGDQVKAGDGIVVVEAMKMQNEIRSPKDGTLKKLLAQKDANVNAGEVLAVLE